MTRKPAKEPTKAKAKAKTSRASLPIQPVVPFVIPFVVPFVEPQLATLVDTAPDGDRWFHELKLDGFRILCRIQNGVVTLFTRTGQDWTARFAEVAEAAAHVGVEGALLDGEIAILRPDGITDFQMLQNHMQGAGQGQLTYFVFDVLFLDGVDLRGRPLEERKARLASLLSRAPSKDWSPTIRYTDHVIGQGKAFFEKARAAGLEGIVSKRRDQPYHGGRGPSWLKIKALKHQELVVGGFTEPEGTRAGIGALLVGFFPERAGEGAGKNAHGGRHGGPHEGQGNGRLSYAGKVGTGFDQKMAAELRHRLDRLVTDKSPFQETVPRAGREIQWVQPELVVEIAYSEMTSDGKLRHPSFQGLREDKPARDVTQEVPRAVETNSEAEIEARPSTTRRMSGSGVAEVNGVKLSHPDRMLEPEAGLTKRDVALYVAAIAPHMLPHLVGRPLSLVRCPEGMAGKCFFMKHATFATPALRRVMIREKDAEAEYLIADSASGLIQLAQMSVLEIHTWNSVEDSLEMPDRVVFDFDPGPEARWQDVVDGATLVKERLDQIGCASFVKTTGGKGLHVVVPLMPRASWDECKVFSQLVSESVVAQHPDRFTTAMRKAGREGKVLIDYFRNNRGSTSVAAYSTRARPGLPISLPVAWDELASFSPARPFTMASALERVQNQQRDPWTAYATSRVDLKNVILKSKAPRTASRSRGRTTS